MKKKHEGLYVNKINKKLNNNTATFYSKYNAENEKKEKDIPSANFIDDGISVETKINKMFNSPNFVYKMNVKLLMRDGKIITKEIIGKVGNKLLTLDEDNILVEDIKGIAY
jgi:hypothetical protein